jgi:non-heme chloroperoxidase
VATWYTDFRKDVAKVDVPTLVMHGDADRIVPIASAGARTGHLIKDAHYVVVKGAPHGMLWTHAAEINDALVKFLS